MRLKKSFQLALNILLHSKLRSWLTIVGIVIGIAAVVAIISISQGAQQQLQARLGGLGADVITVSPGASRARGFGFGGGESGGPGGGFGGSSGTAATSTPKNLTAKDVMILKSISNVKYVEGEVSGRASVHFSTKTATLSVRGVSIDVWKDITTEKLDSGRFLTNGDSYAVVIGSNVANTIFSEPIPVNSKILINDESFKVVGILQDGSTIYMPIGIARNTLENVGKDEFSSIYVKIGDVALSDATVVDVTKKLMMSRGILQTNKQDFSVSSPTAIQESIQQTLNTMTLFLGAIAAISLIVGAVGIANTMFTAVLEKTREIGIMKAIGTQNKDIMTIFLLNSGLIGLIGGLGGVILGYISSAAISSAGGIQTSGGGRGFLGALGSSSIVSPWLVVGALLFSMMIGMIAGAIPAYRASRLNPVDALRYE